MTKRQHWILTVISVVALVLGLLISRRLWFRLDLTKNKAYTISRVSRDLSREIPDQVRITYYVSDKLSAIHPIPGEIEDLLREYATYSRGKIRFIRRDPSKTEMVQAVEQMGIQPRQIQSVERDEATFSTVYTGIAIEYLDQIEVLPWVFSPDTLEYDLSSRIRSMLRESGREVGVLIGDGDKQWTSDYGYLNQIFIQSGYRVRVLSPGEEIGDVLPVLFVLGGVEELDEWALYRIDRYIQNGGKVLFTLEGVFVDTKNTLESRIKNDGGLLAMVASYGAAVQPEMVLDRSALTLQYQTATPSGAIQFRITRYPHWIGVLAENSNTKHPLTSAFGGVDLFWASPIKLSPPESVEGEILLSTTPDAWLMTKDFSANPDTSYLFEMEEPDTRGTKVLAVALSGKFPSWFKDKPKPIREGSGEELPDLPPETRESRIVVIGDSDLATTLIQMTQGQGFQNLDFMIKTADWLGNDDDIIGIRNRQPQAGRLDRIIDPEKRLKAMRFSQIFNVGIIPLGVVVVGIARSLKRRTKTKGKELSDGI
ncbi:MAG: GldG family protein [Spirochaetaceae bacterium]|jgi:gliding-associated putative ABC transporter substrate-binding component GldG|nr:GldG family protein [Spirochaetaceae bacterium]